jgi:RNA polymerase sigma factor (sigma-70 family)
MVMPTDEELIQELLNGSKAAMEVLVKRHYKTVFAFVYRKIGDYHTAYDITQEVFIKMMRALGDYRREGKFNHWLLRIAANSCTDYFRSVQRKSDQQTPFDEQFPDERSNVWDLLSKKLERDQVRKAINCLPKYQQDVVILKFYHGFKLKDIAEITLSKEATVKSRLRQGIAKLRSLLKGDEIREQAEGRL